MGRLQQCRCRSDQRHRPVDDPGIRGHGQYVGNMVGNDRAEQKCSDADRDAHGHAHVNADADTQADANPYTQAEANAAADADADPETDSHPDRNADFCCLLVGPNDRCRALIQSKIHRNHVAAVQQKI